ncbi:MAG: hypothetical protein WCT39_02945, partial [Candidatus Margulisiibacteriota bacterium]
MRLNETGINKRSFVPQDDYESTIDRLSRFRLLFEDKSTWKLLKLAYASAPTRIIEGLRALCDFAEKTKDIPKMHEVCRYMIPFAIYAKCARTGLYGQDQLSQNAENAISIEYIDGRAHIGVDLETRDVSPDWFAPFFSGLADTINRLNKIAVGMERYVGYFQRAQTQIWFRRGHSASSVLEVMGHVERSLFAGKTDEYIDSLFSFEYERLTIQRESAKKPDKWSNKDIRGSAKTYGIDESLINQTIDACDG